MSRTAAPDFAAAATPDQAGTWGPVLDWGVQAKHMVLLPTGNVLLWPTGDNARVWNVSTGAFTSVPATFGDLHCAAQAMLPDGRTVVFGGQSGSPHVGTKVTALFDPFTNTWTPGKGMNYARWYATTTALPDGRMLVTSGDDASGNRITIPEIYDPVTDTWTVLTGADRNQGLYPFMYALPNGKVYEAGRSTDTAILDLAGTGSWSAGPTNPFGSNSYAECDVMYGVGKILRTGGGDPAFARASVIDMTAGSPQWREIAPMAFARRRHNLVILLDGTVMAVGGTRSSDSESQAVLDGEIWDPATELWTTVAAMSEARMYHSSAVLLPDGRVVTAGGEAAGRLHGQIYSPPYFYKGARPTITSSPASGSYGATFNISTPDAGSIDRVALLRPCAATHAIDMNERYVPLTFRVGSGSLSVDAPANSNLAPPGYYMLVIRKSNGVPSVASWIRLDSSANLTPGTISGRVTAQGSGSPISGASVAYSGGSTTTNGSGNYVLANVPPGEHGVTVSKSGFGSVSSSVTVTPGGTTTLDFQLSAPGSIAGRVTSRTTGDPIQGATLSYGGGAATTDATGAYRIDGLAPGNYLVAVSAFGYQASDSSIAVSSGAVSALDFALEPEYPFIAGEVDDASTAAPIQGATVSYSGGSAVTDNLGRYRLSNVAAGTYDVTASASGYASATHQVVVAEIGYSAQDFALDPTTPLTRTFTPVADTDVKVGGTTNNGTATTMRVRFGSPEYQMYLQFAPSGFTGPVQSARLRLYCTDASDDAGSVFRIGDGWTETGITGANAPPISGEALAVGGAAASDAWIELDVTAAVQGPGTVSFGLRNQSSNSCYFSTREGSQPPQLVVQYGGPAPPPSIASFAPASGPVGTGVVVTGSNFTGATAVAFNGRAASWNLDSATQLSATVPAGASSGPISVTTPGGTATSSQSFTVTVPPTITFFAPTSGPTGTVVDVHGSAFTGASVVSFNGTTASFTAVSDTLLRATVPGGAGSGPIRITNGVGTAISAASFTVIGTPVIGSFTPPSGPVGTQVTVQGTGFGGTSAVRFNTTAALFTVDNSTQLRATVPSGAGSGPISVTTPGGTATSSQSFTVTVPPTISFFAPTSGPVGTVVDVHGNGLAAAGTVTFNGTAAPGFTVVSDTLLRSTVPPGAGSGSIRVTTPGGTGTSAQSFTVIPPPVISFFEPTSGPVGAVVDVHGTGLTGSSAVAFNGIAAAGFTVASDTLLRATVSNGADSGPIRVTTPGGTATSAASFTVLRPPTIVSFNPASGPIETVVTVQGTSFGGVTAFRFNGAASSFVIDSATQLRATVPNSATSGPLSVTNPIGTYTTAASFTVVPPPVIGSFSPARGPVGAVVTVLGNRFTGAGAVRFNGTSAGFTIDSDTQLRATVPGGASSGPITVTTSNGTATSAESFIVILPPTIVTFSPAGGGVGGEVTIQGSSFTFVTAVKFNSLAATFTVDSDTQIRATVPSGATSGPIQVTNPAGSFTSSATFTVIPPPTVTSFHPPGGPAGIEVTLRGTSFVTVSAVRFDGTLANFIIDNDTQLRTMAPSGATSGPISVTNPAGTAATGTDFIVILSPAITAFDPASGPVSTVVAISGANLATVSDVEFNGTPAVFTVDSDTLLHATVPLTASSGPIHVTNVAGTAASDTSFFVIRPPTIAAFNPTSGPIGTMVTVDGTNYASVNAVRFNGTAASFTIDSDTELHARVPAGATSGPISVTNPLGTAIGGSFTVTNQVAVDDHGIPLAFALGQNYPNPFRARTRVDFELPRPAKVRMMVFDLHGRAIRTLVDGDRPAGVHEVLWDARDNAGNVVGSGIYLLRFDAGSFTATRRLLRLR